MKVPCINSAFKTCYGKKTTIILNGKEMPKTYKKCFNKRIERVHRSFISIYKYLSVNFPLSFKVTVVSIKYIEFIQI